MQIVHIDTGNLTSIRTTILSFLYLATILGLVVAVSYSKVVLLSSIHITVDTGGYFASYSHCFFGFRRRQGTSRLSRSLDSSSVVWWRHLALVACKARGKRRHRKSRHPRQQGEPHLLLILVDGRERQPISKETDKWTSGMCRV
ncbi:unnamed protein product [Brassica napus]|uniref:(rape) hypothetical protein n=1 Tax=Brassica napus TaxID=3708 RepID=A0A816XXC3_BRANA|nr:unnamed protein product [Brassica napus]